MRKIFPVLQHLNIPNFITTLGLCFGLAACYYLIDGNLRGVLICLAIASLMDLVDGFFAVRMNKQTLFGKHADSLVDFFTCCIMPVFMAHIFMGSSVFLIIGSGLYCVCGLWRLANYNIAGGQTHFTGLPVPAAMLFVTMSIWGVVYYGFAMGLSVLIFIIAGLLMISPVKFKKYGHGQKVLCVIWIGFFITVIVS